MMPGSNQGVGMNQGFPDVCTTPVGPIPTPIPYPNMGMNATSMPFVPNVLMSGCPAHNMGAKPLLTNGDNAGVIHPSFMGPGGCTLGNPRMLLGGQPAEHLTSPTNGNNFNAPVGAKLVPSVTNVLLGYRAPSGRRLADLLHDRVGPASVSGALLSERVGVVRLRRFSLGAARRGRRVVAALLRGGAHALVVDLRGNPGGAIGEAAALASDFVAGGAPLTSCDSWGRGGRASGWVAERPGGFLGLPLVLLVDASTASASEAFVAALMHHAGAWVVGERTFGKGVAMLAACTSSWAAVDDVSALLRGPDGRSWQGQGIRPRVQLGPADAVPGDDGWLEVARRESSRRARGGRT